MWRNITTTVIRILKSFRHIYCFSYLLLFWSFHSVSSLHFVPSGPSGCGGGHLWTSARPLWTGQVWSRPWSPWGQGLFPHTHRGEHSVKTGLFRLQGSPTSLFKSALLWRISKIHSLSDYGKYHQQNKIKTEYLDYKIWSRNFLSLVEL